VHRYAQTIVQLLKQLYDQGYSRADLERVASAYKLAAQLLAGLYRPSGKTFIAHVVGTASILCELHARCELIAAGLLHAAYEHGDFGDYPKGISPAKRDALRKEVGEEVEDYVARYTVLRWTKVTMPMIHEALDTFNQIEREVLTIRLSNELDDLLDFGILYCFDAAGKRRYYARARHMMVDIAEKLGFLLLAQEMAQVLEAAISMEPFDGFRSRHLGVILIVPNSYRQRISIVFRQMTRRKVARMTRAYNKFKIWLHISLTIGIAI
jgi:(p)ppGpp synthase/HD superfamily hydrolase